MSSIEIALAKIKSKKKKINNLNNKNWIEEINIVNRNLTSIKISFSFSGLLSDDLIGCKLWSQQEGTNSLSSPDVSSSDSPTMWQMFIS